MRLGRKSSILAAGFLKEALAPSQTSEECVIRKGRSIWNNDKGLLVAG